MKASDLPEDQKQALRLAHQHHGRNAKAMIRDAWMNGNYSPLDSSIDSGALQRLRNSGADLQKIVISKL